MSDFAAWFQSFTGIKDEPHRWQERLSLDSECRDRLIRIPTGFGKTAGTVAAWMWNRVHRKDDAWPRRLVFCLPMRVLVEQTEAEVRRWLQQDGRLWDGKQPHEDRVGVHVLMGGVERDEWHLWPEHDTILIGTQDMLLSRALNRGYGSPRARWPMELGLLNQDALWVLDEVQLMDVGLLTSAQMQAFRHDDLRQKRSIRPAHTWWMSATTQRWWLESVDTREHLIPSLPPPTDIPAEERGGELWSVRKAITVDCEAVDPKKIADRAIEEHQRRGGLTLVVLNDVKRATETHAALSKKLRKGGPDLRLVHSRFRPRERKQWRQEFLRRDAALPDGGRILVATQVVEAGVDISATTLITDLAPWASLVQRIGRCARYGGSGTVIIVDRQLKENDDKKAAPYRAAELVAAAAAVRALDDAGPLALDAFEAGLSEEQRRELYPYEPLHRLTRRELDELFDTTPDLTGADIDISRFIRSGAERDVSVAWVRVASGQAPPDDRRPPASDLCPVPFLLAREWLTSAEGKKAKRRAWVWDYIEGNWRRVFADRDIFPGQMLVVASDVGGYSRNSGFDPAAAEMADEELGEWATTSEADRADTAQDQEDLSVWRTKTIATHGREVGTIARKLATELLAARAGLAQVFDIAGRWHDVGKAHPAFRGSILDSGPEDLAKARNWASRNKLYRYLDGDRLERRPGFRHELASTAALFSLLSSRYPDHQALLGPFAEVLEAARLPANGVKTAAPVPEALVTEIAALDRDDLNLLAYLVCSHHGKVRTSWHSAPADQNYRDNDGRGLPIRGVREGDSIPNCRVAADDGSVHLLVDLALYLDLAAIGLSARFGPSWSERVARLLETRGVFALAWFEAIFRCADIRASRLDTPDPLLESPQ